jgi:hypothetical protein
MLLLLALEAPRGLAHVLCRVLEVAVELLVVDRRVDDAAVRGEALIRVPRRLEGRDHARAQVLVLDDPPQVGVRAGSGGGGARPLGPGARLRHSQLSFALGGAEDIPAQIAVKSNSAGVLPA